MEDATLSPSVSPSSLLFVLQLQPVSVARGSPILFCQHPCHHVPRVKLSPPQRMYLAQENLQQHPCSLCLKQTRAKPDVCSPAAIFALSPLPYPRRGFGSRPDLSTLAQPQEVFFAARWCWDVLHPVAVPHLCLGPCCQPGPALWDHSPVETTGAVLGPPVRCLLPTVMKYIPQIQGSCQDKVPTQRGHAACSVGSLPVAVWGRATISKSRLKLQKLLFANAHEFLGISMDLPWSLPAPYSNHRCGGMWIEPLTALSCK